MVVRVDKARRNDLALSVDGPPGGRAAQIAKGDDFIAANADIGAEPGVAGTIEDTSVADKEVELLGASERRDQSKDDQESAD